MLLLRSILNLIFFGKWVQIEDEAIITAVPSYWRLDVMTGWKRWRTAAVLFSLQLPLWWGSDALAGNHLVGLMAATLMTKSRSEKRGEQTHPTDRHFVIHGGFQILTDGHGKKRHIWTRQSTFSIKTWTSKTHWWICYFLVVVSQITKTQDTPFLSLLLNGIK